LRFSPPFAATLLFFFFFPSRLISFFFISIDCLRPPFFFTRLAFIFSSCHAARHCRLPEASPEFAIFSFSDAADEVAAISYSVILIIPGCHAAARYMLMDVSMLSSMPRASFFLFYGR